MGSTHLVSCCCVHLLQLWFCSHLSFFYRDQPAGFVRKNRVKILCLFIFLSLVIQQLDWDICLVWIPLIGYGGSSGYSQVAGWTHYVGLFGIPLVGFGSIILAILIQYSKQEDARTV